MKKRRLIPILLLKNGFLVQSKGFSRYQNLGNPLTAVKRLSNWAADELVYLNISRDDRYDMRRDDLGHPNRNNIVDIIKDVSREACMPITFGGRIRTLHDILLFLTNGADKVSVNSVVFKDSTFVAKAVKEFGSQCIVVSIDVKIRDGKYEVMSEGGRQKTGYAPVEWARKVQDYGAGEILINSIDRDGCKNGYDIDLIASVTDSVTIPVIACGGVGEWAHFLQAFKQTNVDAVAAANIFHYIDQSVYLARRFLYEQRCNVRPPDLVLEGA